MPGPALNALAVLALAGVAAPPDGGRDHVGVAGSFERGQGRDAAVVVRFIPLDADVHVNAEPAPRLALDPDQRILEHASGPAPPPPRAAFPFSRYLDTSRGVSFPVRVGRKAPEGRHEVRASVTYFYCSLREGWCRRAQAEVEVAVSVD